MITLNQAVVVEGKYDKIKISSFIKATIITTDGFGIFKNRSKREYIKKLAKINGLIILTDSDRAGQKIRSHIKSFVGEGRIYNAYVPQILGKEIRKSAPSKEGIEPTKEGTLGVEGLKKEVIIQALKKAGVFQTKKNPPQITHIDLMEAGLLGAKNSNLKRKKFLAQLNLPNFLSTKQLLDFLNISFSKEEFQNQITILDKRSD